MKNRNNVPERLLEARLKTARWIARNRQSIEEFIKALVATTTKWVLDQIERWTNAQD